MGHPNARRALNLTAAAGKYSLTAHGGPLPVRRNCAESVRSHKHQINLFMVKILFSQHANIRQIRWAICKGSAWAGM
jgi:hypothetical protein